MHRRRRGDGAGCRDALILPLQGLLALLPGPAEAATFALAVFILNATPGADFLLTVTRTLQGGARAGLAAALGIHAGCVLHALAAAFGLAALLVLHPQAFSAIQWAGAAYLVWLGGGLLRQALRPDAAQATRTAAAVPRRAWLDLRAGLLTNALNPKVALFFLAFLPQFVPAASPDKTASFLLLGGWFVLQSLAFSLLLVALWVALAVRLSQGRASGTARRIIQGLGGGLFIALALRLLKERPVAA